MKKVILTENQIKRMMDKLIVSEQSQNDDINVGKKISYKDVKYYRICNYWVLNINDKWYFEDRTEIPLLSDIKGTVMKGGDQNDPSYKSYPYDKEFKWFIKLDEKVMNGVKVGKKMDENGCHRTTSSLNGGIPICYIDPDNPNGSTPTYNRLFWVSSENSGPHETLRQLKDKSGQVIEMYKTYTQRFKFQFSHGFGDGANEGKLIDYNEIPPPKETPKQNPIVLTFEKGLNDAFNFDQITLNDNGNKNLQDLINYAKQNYQGVSANVPVICSSSIDGDPNQKLKNGMSRSQYNMDLSKRRADAIANMLTTQIGIGTLKFVPQGIGETDKFDPDKKWPEVTDKLQTAGNRKLIIQLPKLQKTIQQK